VERDDPTRRSAGHWWYTGVGGAVVALAVILVLTGRSWALLVNVGVGTLMLLSFGYVTTMGPPPARHSTPSRLTRLDDRLMARFARPRQRPLNRLEKWLQQPDDTYAPDAYRPDARD
jgi:hypothetical protein